VTLFDRWVTTPPLRGAPPQEGNSSSLRRRFTKSCQALNQLALRFQIPSLGGWAATPDGVVRLSHWSLIVKRQLATYIVDFRSAEEGNNCFSRFRSR